VSLWDPKLIKEYGHEGQRNCREDYHRWIVHVVLFSMICGTPHGSSQLGRYGIVKLEAPKIGQEAPSGYKSWSKGKVVVTINP
jgi:hypothetical protein